MSGNGAQMFDVVGAVLDGISLGVAGAVHVRPDGNGGIRIVSTPYLRRRDLKHYLGGISEKYIREFIKLCKPCRRQPDLWHISDLKKFHFERETIAGRFGQRLPRPNGGRVEAKV